MTKHTSCLRPRCRRKATRQRLCPQHYELVPRGYVASDLIRDRVKLLRERGYGLRELSEITGVSQPTLLLNFDTVQLATARAIMAIPVPNEVIPKGARVPAVGVARRVQSLVAFGYPQKFIAAEIGVTDKRLSQILKQPAVSAAMAARVAVVFDRLQMVPGPSNRSKILGAKAGWVLPWAWDEESIDRPDASPLVSVRDKWVRFDDRYEELRASGFSHSEIAAHLGIKGKSLQRQMIRYGYDIRGLAS